MIKKKISINQTGMIYKIGLTFDFSSATNLITNTFRSLDLIKKRKGKKWTEVDCTE